ncbi:MAG: M28 family peptidase [candidate division KSB1 bacterium]|nr:M28 family peptidase [candidate division KSB1 bacterium]MDZ7335597.1 M28 family peptidase [candidate division KSB1 bacterium]MDZ7357567.1 M28 family peptidase [candidate division KSB1 bacterium]MDZ7375655.1 M28 family peptidase [candidate division KSB1 bacterium]MDZ7399776.1 M28 family peptidase [candidate division KSB1 bacterium]
MNQYSVAKKKFYLVVFSFLLLGVLSCFLNSDITCCQPSDANAPYASIARAIIDTALVNPHAYSLLRELCYNIGPRLCGSPQAAAAVEWSRQVMTKLGFDNVHLQPVTVPHWERGDIEEAAIINSSLIGTVPLSVCALGGSVATPETGIVAEVIEVRSLKEAAALGRKAQGKIVFYNRPMDPKTINTFAGYGGAVDQRTLGAIEAAKVGAVAVLVRSITTRKDNIPHTGLMHYDASVPKIPAAAVSTVAADLLSQLIAQEKNVRVRLRLSCQNYPMVQSANVIGEIRGTERPDEVILIGGHLDSWDVGHGAHDDGAGCVQTIEALRLIKCLRLKPKRTIRAVLFMCEEFGIFGGPAYADSIRKMALKHIAAIEADRGGFTPRGFGINADDRIVEKLKRWQYLFEPIDAANIFRGGGGADISPLEPHGTITIGLMVDFHRYFDYHHSANDVFEAVNERELELGAAALAIFAYVLAMEGI